MRWKSKLEVAAFGAAVLLAACNESKSGSGGGDTATGATGSTSSESNESVTSGTSAGETDEPLCGNGVVDEGETCDDGNAIDGDGCNVDCEPSGRVLWELQYGTEAWEWSLALDVAPSGNIALCVSFYSDADGESLHVVDLDPEGNEIWTAVIDKTDEDGWYCDIVFDEAGNVVVATDVADEVIVQAYGGDGSETWSDSFFGWATSVVALPDGGVVAGGQAPGDGWVSWDAWLRRYDADGTEAWTAFYAGEADLIDSVWGIGLAADGSLVAAGMADGDSADVGYSLWVAKYSGDGAELWATVDPPPAGGDRGAHGVAVGPDGEIVVAGWDLVEGQNHDALIRKLDPDGTVLWTEHLHNVNDDYALGVDIDSVGNVAAGGQSWTAGQDYNGWITKLDPEGNALWSDAIDGPESGRDITEDLLVLSGDRIMSATGIEGDSTTSRDILLRIYAP